MAAQSKYQLPACIHACIVLKTNSCKAIKLILSYHILIGVNIYKRLRSFVLFQYSQLRSMEMEICKVTSYRDQALNI